MDRADRGNARRFWLSGPSKIPGLFALGGLTLLGVTMVGFGATGRPGGAVSEAQPVRVVTESTTTSDPSFESTAAELSELHWLAPEPDERLHGSYRLRWRLPEGGLSALEVWIDERRLLKASTTDEERVINTKFLSNGPHRLELRAKDPQGLPVRASVDVRIHNPDFAILNVSGPRTALGPRDSVGLTLKTRGQGFEPWADLTAIDSHFDPEKVRWQEVGEGVFEMSYALSSDNSRPDGNYRAAVALVDRTDSSIRKEASTRIGLRSTNPLDSSEPPFSIPCAFFRPEPLPPGGEASPAIARGTGPTNTSVGASVSLRVEWSVPPLPDQRFLRVTVDGLEGYFALHGSCGQRDEIPLIFRQASPAAGYRVAVWPGTGIPASHRIVVRP